MTLSCTLALLLLAQGAEAAVDGGSPPLFGSATAELPRQLAAERHAEALRHHRQGDYPAALQGFREAHQLDPHNSEITNNLAHLHGLLGNKTEAERLYRETLRLDPKRAIAHLNLADLLHEKGASPERLTEAAEHLTRARELQGNRPGIILRQARVAAQRGQFEDAERHYRDYLSRRKPDSALRIELGDFYRDFGRDEEATAWYRQVPQSDRLHAEAARRMWRLRVEGEARRLGWTGKPGDIPEKARTLARNGRIRHQQGRHAEAERLLREAVRMAPQFAMARADLGDLLRDLGRTQEAELSYLRALAVDQGNAEIYLRMGELYRTARQGARAAEAVLFLSRALQLRPDWTHLHLKLARACRAAGDVPRALGHVNRYLADATNPDDRREAFALKLELEYSLAPGAEAQSPGAPRPGEPDRALRETLARARAFLAQGEPDAAMAELRRVRGSDRGTEIMNLEGRILLASGRLDEAAARLRESLAREEAQAQVHEQLGVIFARQGVEASARAHQLRAEALGSAAAPYHLARLDVPDRETGVFGCLGDLGGLGRLLEAKERLDGFLERGAAAYREEAQALRERVGERIQAAVASGAGIGLALILAALLAWRRLWGGIDLKALLERHPEVGPEVQRILSAIRHEVLKHNTLVLTGLVEAVERGVGAAEKAAYCRSSLFGGNGGEGAAERLRGYAAQLQQLGRAHGERLNLKRRDPALSALRRGFRGLRRVAPLLGRVEGLSRRERGRLLRQLKGAVRLLNTEGYEAVRALLDQIRVLQVDRALLVSVYERTCREPALAGAVLAPLDLDLQVDLPCGVLIPRRAFEDILANLVRNAIQSSLRHRQGESAIGLGARREVDAITGVERVVFLIRDRSPQVLTAEMIRGRYIEEGLGLTADLVSRYEGTLDVLPGEGGWTKAVAVKLPLADPGFSLGEEK